VAKVAECEPLAGRDPQVGLFCGLHSHLFVIQGLGIKGIIDHVYLRARSTTSTNRLGSARTFTEYVRALKALGVDLADGHSEYFGQGGHRVVSPPVHEVLPLAESGQRETFLQHRRQHEQRLTTHLEMSRGLARSRIEKWAVDTDRMTMTFYDKAGREMLVEQIS
jgi:hypothetical protein